MPNQGKTTPQSVFVLLLLLEAAYLLHCWVYWEYVNDDAFISFRYSKNLAMGRGLVYNPGQHVEGYTNFLYTLVFAGILRIWPDLTLMVLPKFFGLAAGQVVLVTAYSIARKLLDAGGLPARTAAYAGVVAPALIAANSAFAVNSVSGLETIPFAALILLGIHGDVNELLGGRNRFGWLWYALAVLTRPEGLAIFGLAVVGRLVLAPQTRRWPALLRHLGPVAVVVAAHLVFRLIYYDGEWLPNTYWAKQGGATHATGMQYVWRYLSTHELSLGWLIGVLGIWALSDAARRAALVMLIVAAGFLCTFAITGAGWMFGSRLIMPVVPHMAILTAIGLTAGVVRLSRGGTARSVGLNLLAAVVLLLVLDSVQEYGQGRHMAELVRIRSRGYYHGHLAMSRWLRKSGTLRPGDTIALMDIGLVGFRNMDCRVLDITGLTDRRIAKSPGSFLNKEYPVEYVLDQHPRVIVAVLGVPPGQDPPKVTAWTGNDERILRALGGRSDYRRTKIFEHDFPGPRYLLAVFVRQGDGAKRGN